MGSEFWIVVRWWGTLFLVGAAAYPLTRRLFSRGNSQTQIPGQARNDIHFGWFDHGYLFAKAVGVAVVTYIVYLFGIVHALPFTTLSIWIALALVFVGGIWLNLRNQESGIVNHEKNTSIHNSVFNIQVNKLLSRRMILVIIEEVFFLVALVFWSWVKGHEPSIHGLEKFMDFGFTKSILNSRFFPAPDMWYSGLTINYYYFGHTVLAVLTKLSGLDLAYTFNLMLATLFSFTFTMSFSIGLQLVRMSRISRLGQLGGGLLTAFLVTLGGNMQTIYAFTKGYTGENVQPFWVLAWNLSEIGQRIGEGLDRYWYANATRFIPYTIHEFPSYSFVVSDIHGHVLSLPFVLLAIALLIRLWAFSDKGGWGIKLFYGFLCGVLLMTNALDGPIYLGLFIILFVLTDWTKMFRFGYWKKEGWILPVTVVTTLLASMPFLWHFKSFVTGVAVNCPPGFLANVKIGPVLFEGVEKCQHSPFWMMWLLWGFFWFCGAWLLGAMIKRRITGRVPKVLLVFFVVSLALIVFPEFFYFKDIYPAHFRSNTMFKFGYQAFIMWSILSGYTIVRYAFFSVRRIKLLFFVLLLPQLFLVSIFPYFAVRSYFGNLRAYESVYGLGWLKTKYPDDWAAIEYLNQELRIKNKELYAVVPVIVEADGDSYTDYARISAFTGLPTIVGWPVHEWLWRGSYDVVAPRREVVRKIYESTSSTETSQLLSAYRVRYIVIGSLERQKYPRLYEQKFIDIAREVYAQGETKIYAY